MPDSQQPEAAAPVESVYLASELVAAARQAFGVEPYLVAACLKYHKIASATRQECSELVQQFLRMEA